MDKSDVDLVGAVHMRRATKNDLQPPPAVDAFKKLLAADKTIEKGFKSPPCQAINS